MLLHLCPAGDWVRALRRGRIDPLPEVGFVHLSAPDQVHLPAGRLFAGRDDVLLLVVDPARLTDPVRLEPGVPGDPESMRFPHLYGPLPATAVVAVQPWAAEHRLPVPEADDPAGRHAALETSLPLRRALASGEPVQRRAAGWAVGSPDHPVSGEDNRLLLPAPVGTAQVLADAGPLVPGAAAAVTWCWPGADDAAARLAHDLAGAGWRITADRVMSRSVPPATGAAPDGGVPDGAAEVVDQTDVHPLWAEAWRGLIPDDPAAVRQLVDREHRTARAVGVIDVGVRDRGRVVAAGQLRTDGATAAVEAVLTDPAYRGRGLGDAVLARLLVEAARAGCDLAVLAADPSDWPRHWYARRGFDDVGVVRSATPPDQAGTSQLSSR
ncbi:GNAT family N-acetyltransferase [Klenkia sp. LSe6-5]|uniref:GNAT family N-acetyltransferase n=1 Tax=Klenkia sesuvii TaxID=3103137 RepID=A0ABU8DXI0_9ACTN